MYNQNQMQYMESGYCAQTKKQKLKTANTKLTVLSYYQPLITQRFPQQPRRERSLPREAQQLLPQQLLPSSSLR